MASELETLIASLREADAKMTPGPWVSDYCDQLGPRISAPGVFDVRKEAVVGWPQIQDNERYIALLRNTAPVVAKVIEELVAGLNEDIKEAADKAHVWGCTDPLTGRVHDAGLRDYYKRRKQTLESVIARVNQIIEGTKDAR